MNLYCKRRDTFKLFKHSNYANSIIEQLIEFKDLPDRLYVAYTAPHCMKNPTARKTVN